MATVVSQETPEDPAVKKSQLNIIQKKTKGSLRNNHKIVKEPARKTTKSNSKFYEKYLIQDNAKKESGEDIIFLDVDQLYGIVGAGLCLIFILKIFQKQ
eukprot:snap_masked-scaffold_4-processed-gene-21.39-mRNA-1 protein AED:1.00 eAED:1.00 QI:0/0/0/0/1/1/5/0/98